MANKIDINNIENLDEFFKYTQEVGSVNKAVSNNLYGLNHQGVDGIIPENRDSYGMAFFTRPQLNLKSANLRNDRKLYSLLTTNPASIQRYTRCLLDPRLRFENINTPLLDPRMAFIPVFTNNLKSMSGWPDIVLPTFTSKEGVRKEQYIQADGHTDIYESFDLDCTFRNTKDEPIISILITWLRYMANVFEGMFSPYLDYIVSNRIDYQTRIYRLVLDESKRYVKKIAATGASFPVNVPTGKFFDLNKENKYNDQTRDINVRFKSVGAMYNDDILIQEFNKTGAVFNPEIRNLINGRPHSLEKIPYDMLSMFNNRGYPVINAETLELEWWVDKNSLTYKSIMETLSNQ
jgi:hypothetical protein